jgi:cytochrome c oxidase cbb3-type subunit III
MSSRSRRSYVCAIAWLALLAGCEREERRLTEVPPAGSAPGVVRYSPLQPGPAVLTTAYANPYDENAYAVSQGQRLYAWYNCAGCHANGGGGMGPALMDDEWVYGSGPANIYQTIMQGRPNGMPSWAGRIPDSQVWQIVAYVRSMSGLTPASTRSARTDHMMTLPGSATLMSPEDPKVSFVPPPSKSP